MQPQNNLVRLQGEFQSYDVKNTAGGSKYGLLKMITQEPYEYNGETRMAKRLHICIVHDIAISNKVRSMTQTLPLQGEFVVHASIGYAKRFEHQGTPEEKVTYQMKLVVHDVEIVASDPVGDPAYTPVDSW